MTTSSPSKQLIKNTIIYGIGGLGSKLLAFLLLPLFAFYLSKDELGIYDLILVSVNLIIPCITLQLTESIYRWLIDTNKDEHLNKVIVSNGIISTVIFYALFVLIYMVCGYFWDIQYKYYILAIILFSIIFLLLQQIARGLGDNKLYAKGGILNALLMLLFCLLYLVVLKKGISGILIATALSNLFSAIYVGYKLKINRLFSLRLFHRGETKKMISYSLPLVPNSISWWLINASNKYIILLFLSTEANGLYAVSSRFPAIITILNSIFMLSWQDYVLSNENNQGHSRIFKHFIHLEVGLVLILIATSPFIVSLFFDADYAESWKYMGVLYLAAAFSAFSAFYGNYFLRKKDTKNIFLTTLAGGIVNLLISISLIKQIGLYAPALGTLVGFIVTYLIRVYIINKEYALSLNILPLAFGILASGVVFFFTLYNNHLINLLLTVVTLLIFYWLNSTLIKQNLSLLKDKIKGYLK